MKLRIEKKFTDKNTGEQYNVGDVKEFDAARAKELLSDNRGLVSKTEEVKPVEPVEPAEPIEQVIKEPKKETKKSKK